ncbi:MAG TPA: DedA family protein [Halothiobacillus sp.]|nr:DedA family protein [Halothiobacillus sp.]
MFGIDIAALLAQYGLLFLAIGCLLEGETVLVLAGLAAHQGWLGLPEVLIVAMVFGWMGDQIFFWLGRWKGDAILLRFPRWARQKPRLDRWIHKYHAPVVIMVRFMYGLRAAGPVLIGHSGLCPWKFMLYNAIGAIIWAVLFIGLGWVFGQAAEQVLTQINHWGHYVFYVGAVVILVVGIGIWLWNQRRAARLARAARQE